MPVSEVKTRVSAEGVAQFKAAMADASRALDSVGKSAKGQTDFVGGFGNALRTAGAVAMVAGGGLLAGGAMAVNAAANFERLTATFEALTGSASVARQKMEWLKSFAATSTLEMGDLAEAGTQLQASGLVIERIIPLISNMAGAFGGGRDKVLELASAFGRLPSGQFGESMEIFRRFGMGAQDLMARGIRFDGGGQIVSSAGEVMDAIAAIADQKFGGIGKTMGKTFAVQFSNLKDSFNQMMAGIGESLLPMAKQLIGVFTDVMNWVKASGFFESISRSFATVMGLSADWTTSLKEAFSWLAATVKVLAERLAGFAGTFGTLRENLSGWAPVVAGIWAAVKALQMMAAIATGLSVLTGKGAGVKAAAVAVAVGAATWFGADWLMKRGAATSAGIAEYQKQIMGDLMRGAKPAAGVSKAPVAPGFFLNEAAALAGPGAMKTASAQGKALDSIAASSRITAANTSKLADQRRYVVGGGPRAGVGVTPVEINSYRAGAGRAMVRVEAGGKALNAAIEELFAAFLVSARRQGLV